MLPVRILLPECRQCGTLKYGKFLVHVQHVRRVKCDGAYLICDLLRHALIRELPHTKCYGCEASAASAHLDELEEHILEFI